MPCPLFLPGPPAGDYYLGRCAAAPATDIAPGKLRSLCNRGYARHACPAADTVEADAAQLLIQSRQEATIAVSWSLERDHHPLAVGVLTLTPGQPAVSPLECQAAALVSAYLEQTT